MMMKKSQESSSSNVNGGLNQAFIGCNSLSIMQKRRADRVAAFGSKIPPLRSENVVYNGIGGSTKVLQSDLKNIDNMWTSSKPAKRDDSIKRKKLSPSMLGK